MGTNDNVMYMQLFKGLIGQISSAASDVMLEGAGKLLEDDTVAKYIKENKIQPYMYLSGMLNLLGREMNAESMSKVMNGIGMEADDKLINALLKANDENAVIYIYSIYFLVILQREHNVDNIMRLVDSLGVKPNKEFAQNALDFYNKKYDVK